MKNLIFLSIGSNIGNRLKNIKTSVLARGLPIGSDLEYTDDLTLVKALEGRKLLE